MNTLDITLGTLFDIHELGERFLGEFDGWTLSPSVEVLDSLREKYLSPADIQPNSLLFGPIIDLCNIWFDLDEQRILATARSLKGSAGPSDIDANQLICILC